VLESDRQFVSRRDEKMSGKSTEEIERRREVMRRYNNKPERKAYMREWYEKNKERHRELGRKWQRENLEYSRALVRDGYRRNRTKRLEKGRNLYHRDKLTPKMIVKNLWGGAKRRARENGIEFSLSKEWVLEQVNSGVCAVSGLAFEPGSGLHHPMSPSLDRISRDFGYTQENTRLVIWAVNNLKGIGSDETMWKVVEAMIEHRKKRGHE
jgi:hypothetical protein